MAVDIEKGQFVTKAKLKERGWTEIGWEDCEVQVFFNRGKG